MSFKTLAGILPLSLLAACNSVQDRPVGSFPSDTNMVQFRKEMAELAEPGLEHENLKKRVGDWTIALRQRANEAADWREDSGTSSVRVALDGRYLVEEISASIDGRAFHGYTVMGYNRLEGRFFSVWMDSHTTWPMYADGERGADGVLRMSGRVRDVVTPGGRPFHIDETRVSDDEYLREVYDTVDGQPVKTMEIRRTRR